MQKVFHRAARAGDIAPGTGQVVRVGDDECVLFLSEDGLHYGATAVLCPHQNEPLDRGRLEGVEVICRRHHLRFDIRTGDCTNARGYSLCVYEVRVDGDDILIGRWED